MKVKGNPCETPPTRREKMIDSAGLGQTLQNTKEKFANSRECLKKGKAPCTAGVEPHVQMCKFSKDNDAKTLIYN
jgi:hypothetical protein